MLLMFSLLPLLSGCDNEDDVIGIFTGKTWKLSRLTNKGSNAQFYPNLWNNNEEEIKKSQDKLYNQKSTFTLNFEGTELDGELMGTTVNGQGINSSVNGTWKADGASGSLSISVKVTGAAESDALAKAFISGLQNVYKYEGDANSLTLYFKDGPTTRVMGFTPQRDKQEALDRRYIRMASIWAENSYCQRRQVGALIVKDKMIISDGYNGTPSGFENVCEDENNVTKPYVLHAEANAITKIARSNNSSNGATMYVTASPCIECSKLIIQAGIKRVVYSEKYRLEDGIELLKRAGIEVVFISMDNEKLKMES